jgi:hypothetical protein
VTAVATVIGGLGDRPILTPARCASPTDSTGAYSDSLRIAIIFVSPVNGSSLPTFSVHRSLLWSMNLQLCLVYLLVHEEAHSCRRFLAIFGEA